MQYSYLHRFMMLDTEECPYAKFLFSIPLTLYLFFKRNVKKKYHLKIKREGEF